MTDRRCWICGGTLRVEEAVQSGSPGSLPAGSTLLLVHKPEECIAVLVARVKELARWPWTWDEGRVAVAR